MLHEPNTGKSSFKTALRNSGMDVYSSGRSCIVKFSSILLKAPSKSSKERSDVVSASIFSFFACLLVSNYQRKIGTLKVIDFFKPFYFLSYYKMGSYYGKKCKRKKKCKKRCKKRCKSRCSSRYSYKYCSPSAYQYINASNCRCGCNTGCNTGCPTSCTTTCSSKCGLYYYPLKNYILQCRIYIDQQHLDFLGSSESSSWR